MSEVREALISLPEPVIPSAMKIAAEENRSVGDLMQELLARHESDARWLELLAYGRERGKASGYTQEDVVPMMRETRKELPEERNQGKPTILVRG